MADGKATRSVKVTNPQGLHARPADLFVRCAKQYEAKIEVINGDVRADGKSILSVLMLVALEGTQLQIEAEGPDADAALDALVELVRNNFAEEQLH